jgi:archaemetzincin
MASTPISFPQNERCEHEEISLQSSAHASDVGYHRATETQRALAASCAKPNKRPKKNHLSTKEGFFPAPLVLPGDDLAEDPEYPKQNLLEWLQEEERNAITPDKNIIYVATFPEVDPKDEFVRSWARPEEGKAKPLAGPRAVDVVDYIAAFYHGLPVKLFPNTLRFVPWDDNPKSKSKKPPSYIGFSYETECVRIRTRPAPDAVFARQLNLDDLLDAAITMLPEDAYALLLVVEQDIYEQDDDVFTCGRAYGGSRVAVVSTARYNPLLDTRQDVDRLHSWPASHCEKYMESKALLTGEALAPPAPKRTKASNGTKGTTRSRRGLQAVPPEPSAHDTLSPLHAAVSVFRAFDHRSQSLTGLWLGRVCRTVCHELGHCFGMDHCVYYACSMQGTCSLAEDARQPPYLCPVDLAKMLHATGTTAEQRYERLLGFCETHSDVALFSAFGRWLRLRLDDIKSSNGNL